EDTSCTRGSVDADYALIERTILRKAAHSGRVKSRMGPVVPSLVSRTPMVPWGERPTSTQSESGTLWGDLRQPLYCCFTLRPCLFVQPVGRHRQKRRLSRAGSAACWRGSCRRSYPATSPGVV